RGNYQPKGWCKSFGHKKHDSQSDKCKTGNINRHRGGSIQYQNKCDNTGHARHNSARIGNLSDNAVNGNHGENKHDLRTHDKAQKVLGQVSGDFCDGSVTGLQSIAGHYLSINLVEQILSAVCYIIDHIGLQRFLGSDGFSVTHGRYRPVSIAVALISNAFNKTLGVIVNLLFHYRIRLSSAPSYWRGSHNPSSRRHRVTMSRHRNVG